MENENLLYWHGKPVGIEANGRVTWFTGASREAKDALSNLQPPRP